LFASSPPAGGCGEDGCSRRCSWRRASGFAECTDVSQLWHRNASSAAQYHRARRRRHPSHARAALLPTAAPEATAAELLVAIISLDRVRSPDVSFLYAFGIQYSHAVLIYYTFGTLCCR
jgi:hypothetical protein